MPKTMNVLAFVLGLAAAGTALSAPPVASKEFTFDEKANAELARRLKIPVYFAVPASARISLPKTIETSDRLIDFKHPDGKSAQGDVGLRIVMAQRAGFAQRLGKSGLIQTGDVLLTYLIHPGTAFYAGFTDTRENLALVGGPPTLLERIRQPSLTTGRQFFVKLSYLFRI